MSDINDVVEMETEPLEKKKSVKKTIIKQLKDTNTITKELKEEIIEKPAAQVKKPRTPAQIAAFERAQAGRKVAFENRKLEKMKILVEKGLIKPEIKQENPIKPPDSDSSESEAEEILYIKKNKPKRKKQIVVIQSDSDSSSESEAEIPEKVFKSHRNKNSVKAVQQKVIPKDKINKIKNYFAD